MEKYKRNERIGAIIKLLSDHPNKVLTYSSFSEQFQAAKSSISEDILVVKRVIERMNMGIVETVSGAAGGVKYLPTMTQEQKQQVLHSVCEELMEPERIIPGGFLYYTDVIYRPDIVDPLGKMIAGEYLDQKLDSVVTMETKGIPVALMTAKYLNVPLTIIRKQNKVTDGTTVSLNYVSATSGKISTMSLSKRALKKNAKVILVDDFMKGGGTAVGMVNLMKEFEAEVKGISVLISAKKPEAKMIEAYKPLLVLEKLDQNTGEIVIYPFENEK